MAIFPVLQKLTHMSIHHNQLSGEDSPRGEGHDGVAQLRIGSHPAPHILDPHIFASLSEIMGNERVTF